MANVNVDPFYNSKMMPAGHMIEARPIKPGFGAVIETLNLVSATDRDFDKLYELWLTHKLLVIRSQDLSDNQLEQFSARFGRLDTIPYFNKIGMTEAEFIAKGLGSIYILPISNIEKDGVALGALGDGEVYWHADTNYMKTPCVGMVLFGVIIPEVGGNTQFADQEAAYDALPPDLKVRIENLSIKHDASHTSDLNMRPGFEDYAAADIRDLPGEVHPIVYTHPETGRNSLALGRRAYACVTGLELADSEALLDELWEYAVDPAHVISHKWQVGDVIVWDNRCLLHQRGAYTGQRFLKRCQIKESRQHE